jgi:hypothetical protein
MSHIEFLDLLRTFEQPEASLSRRPDVTEHLSDCTKCSAVYQKLSDFFDHSRRVKAERVPQATTAHLLNIFRPLPKRSPEKPAASAAGFVRHVRAGAIGDHCWSGTSVMTIAGEH